MASITLKNIPEDLHARFKRLAQKNSRSLQTEIFLAMEERIREDGFQKDLKVEEVAGMLTSDVKGVSVEEMHRGIDEMFCREWKR